MTRNIYIKTFEGEIVHTVPVENPNPRKVERIVTGMLRNMNTDRFYVDDSECDEETAEA